MPNTQPQHLSQMLRLSIGVSGGSKPPPYNTFIMILP